MEVKKAIIPIAGLGKRFRPFSNILPKELWPLVDKPVIEYIIEEAVSSGVKKLIFVNRPGKKILTAFLKEMRGKMKTLSPASADYLNNFPQIIQKKPLGDGHAILQAEKLLGKEPFAVLFGDDIVESKVPCLLQLIKVFKKYTIPVVALHKIPKEKTPSYGMAAVKKIENNLYQIKEIIEKPKVSKAPSNAQAKRWARDERSSASLAIVGKYILTPDIFNYLKKVKPGADKEVRLADALKAMLKAGQTVLGLRFEGKWLECGNKLTYLQSNIYLSKKHPEFGKELKKIS